MEAREMGGKMNAEFTYCVFAEKDIVKTGTQIILKIAHDLPLPVALVSASFSVSALVSIDFQKTEENKKSALCWEYNDCVRSFTDFSLL